MRPAESLTGRIATELAQPVSVAAQTLCDTIVDRHGETVAAVLFYGSCLRKQTHEGVLDFYVIVDRYRDAYPSRTLAIANALVPPNVFYLVAESPVGTVRCKYAVISRSAFAHGTSPKVHQPYFWARFAQPAAIAYARDDESRHFVEGCVSQAIVTLVRRLCVFMPVRGNRQGFSPAALWQEAFRRTYACELRPESPETIRGNYEADPERYDEVAGEALAELAEQGWLDEVEARGRAFEIAMPVRRRLFTRLRWHAERPLAKALAIVRLFKNATTFGDWLPYILWKVERHTGKPVELTDRQRAHPFIFGLPVLARLLWRREIF